MDYNYHCHTALCGHAANTMEEYLLSAMEGGIKYFGFSDHIPFRFPDGFESNHRVPTEKAPEYIAEARRLREKYKNKIELSIGFEMEYYFDYFEEMLRYAKDLGAEYLILGQHFLYNEHPNGFHCNRSSDKVEDLENYVSLVISGMKSGVFSYVAHPDMLRFDGDPEAYAREMRKICVASRERDIPLEINFLGIRGNRNYPNREFWKLAGEEGAPVTFGFDAHDAASACDRDSLVKAQRLVNTYALNYIGKPKLIHI